MRKGISFFLVFVLGTNVLFASEDQSLEIRQRSNKLSRTTPNITTLSMKQGVTYQLQTAIGYITTIDLPEDARKVFVGDAELFKVEVYDKEVIVKPATDYADARTNLTIYTNSARLTFDITVGDPKTADFVLDFHFPTQDAMVQNEFKAKVEEKKGELEKIFQEKEAKQDQKVQELSQKKFEEELKSGTKTKSLKISEKRDGMQLNLLALTQIGNKSYLRYSLFNYSDQDYEIQSIVLGKETVLRGGLNLRSEGFVPVETSMNIEKTIAKNSYHYGLLSYSKVYLQKNEQLTLKVYGKDNPVPLQITKIPTEVE